jgi:predicted DNA-binding transcriptional regulator YafY
LTDRVNRYHDSQQIKEMPDGSLEVSFLLSGAQEMIPWLMTWGSTIEPLEPQWLRQALAEQLAKALEIYHT